MPPKPRVHAPKRGPVDPATKRQRLILYALAASGIVALAAVGVLIAATGSGGGGGTDEARVRGAAEAAGCTFVSKPALPASHSITSPDGVAKWNTDPPTTGPHYEVPAVFGSYSEPLQPARLVHNLEHGGVFIQYGKDVPEATVRQLQAFYADHDRGTLLSPLPRLGKQIALGAWVTPSEDKPDEGKGYLMKCTRFDEAAFVAFLEEFQYKGPERFPADSLLPGH